MTDYSPVAETFIVHTSSCSTVILDFLWKENDLHMTDDIHKCIIGVLIYALKIIIIFKNPRCDRSC